MTTISGLVPEAANFLAELDRIQRSREESMREHDERYALGRESTERTQARRAIIQNHNDKIEQAWGNLKTSRHRLLAWIANNVSEEYRDQAKSIIGQLTLTPRYTLDSLNAFASTKSWCDVWDDFRDRAIAAGVIANNLTIEYKVNNIGRWQRLTDNYIGYGGYANNRRGRIILQRETVAALFSQGSSEVSIAFGNEILRFRLREPS